SNAQNTPSTMMKSLRSSSTSTKIPFLTESSAAAADSPIFADGIEIISFCNDPGKAYKSQISPVQLMYTDGESVVYTCDEFISLKQRRKCVHGKWEGETPVCGAAFRNNDMTMARFFDGDTGRLTAAYNVTGKLEKFEKFGNSFIAERIPSSPVRGLNASNYYIEIFLEKPTRIQMVRISFSVVNHLTDQRLLSANFDVFHVEVSPYRECTKVNSNSVSPWHYNSTRFDYWFFCRSKSMVDFNKEAKNLSSILIMETSAKVPVDIDMATFILADQYSNNDNHSDPICGLPEVPVGLEARVVNDQTNYAFQCAKNFRQVDSFGGQTHLRTCGFDLRWHGELPTCYPTKTCSKFNLQSTNFLVEVFKYDRIYFTNDKDWLAIPGSRAFFRCKDETHIFVGKEIRVCEEDGEWSNSMPNCLISALSSSNAGLNTNVLIIVVLVTLIITFLFSACTIYFFLKMRSQAKSQPTQFELNDAAYYASSQIDPISGKLVDETYEALEPFDVRYASVRDNQAYNPMNAPPLLLKTSPIETDSSYTSITDYNTGYPVPAPRSIQPKQPQENEYYDDTIMDAPIETYQDSYQVMRKM
ncbi:hypothetical protein TYRP_012467, partial [Tyrophagus putrescentiae]